MDSTTHKHPSQQAKASKQIYIATDGSLKSCITGPVLELPIDFHEWPKSDTRNVVLFASKAA
ncbi:hypothetical protein NP603_01445 [Methylomonas sp. SURF-1]|uniref:Uncharacterized protein n=1 Tax=Methylomonas aurea TaxID=2952224 RepID=A0ABT1UC07_9GAMM|nr:hypothetical protein [Methylomonas sp. SURF-1]MCQ8179760.1 hypothetical protein [Methylomonas sp. SURF-1]